MSSSPRSCGRTRSGTRGSASSAGSGTSSTISATSPSGSAGVRRRGDVRPRCATYPHPAPVAAGVRYGQTAQRPRSGAPWAAQTTHHPRERARLAGRPTTRAACPHPAPAAAGVESRKTARRPGRGAGCGGCRQRGPAGGAASRWVTGIPWAPVSTLRSGPAAGTGLATVTPDGTVLDTWYPAPVLGGDAPDVPRAGETGGRGRRPRGAHHGGADADRLARRAPADAADVYLRLHLLSHRLVRPHA